MAVMKDRLGPVVPTTESEIETVRRFFTPVTGMGPLEKHYLEVLKAALVEIGSDWDHALVRLPNLAGRGSIAFAPTNPNDEDDPDMVFPFMERLIYRTDPLKGR
jgi:hypothetical protein